MDFSYNKVTEWFECTLDTMLNNRKQVLLGVAGVLVLTGSIVGYTYYNQWNQAAAHKDFVQALRYYEAPVTGSKTVMTADVVEFSTDEEKWKNVEAMFEQGFQKHGSTGLGSMFQVYQVDALTRLGKIDEAIEKLTSAIATIPSKEVKDFYTLKLALMKFDSAHKERVQEGLAQLKAIAENEQNNAHEAALYYLGEYYWSAKDYDQVKNYWQQLMVKYGLKEAKKRSGFSEIVRAKLKLISPEW